MLRVVRAEITKLRRARVFLWSIAVVVFFAFMSLWTMQLSDTKLSDVTWRGMLSGSPTNMAAWWGILIFSMAAAHLFGAEFSEGTAASLLTMPIRRESFVAAKVLVLAAWVATLALVSVLAHVGMATLVGADGFAWEIVWKGAGQTFEVAFMLFLTLPVIALISLYGRGYLAPMLFASGVMAVNIAAGFLGWERWFPWTMPSTVAGGMAPPTEIIGTLGAESWAILIAMFVLGLAGVFAYVNRAGEEV